MALSGTNGSERHEMVVNGQEWRKRLTMAENGAQW